MELALMAGPGEIERRKDQRRQGGRRADADRRSGEDRRSNEPAGVTHERRTGWDRRIYQRRGEHDRRSGGDRRKAAELPHVALAGARRLVSRLVLLVAKTPQASQTVRDRLAEARSEILSHQPDVPLVKKKLDQLARSSVAKLAEYQLARDLLAEIAQAEGGNDAGSKPDGKLRHTLHHLPALLAEPLERPPAAGGKPKASSAKKGAKPRAKRKTASRKAAKRSGRRSTKPKRRS